MGLPKGSLHPNAKLTEEDACQILELIKEKRSLQKQLKALSHRAIAEKFDVSRSTVCDLAQGKNWLHIQEDSF